MDDLAELFAAYRDAMPDRDPGPDFMPGLWRRIDRRRSPVRLLRVFAQAFAAVAVTVVLLIGMVLIPRMQTAPVYSASYIDVLENEHSNELAFGQEAPPAR